MLAMLVGRVDDRGRDLEGTEWLGRRIGGRVPDAVDMELRGRVRVRAVQRRDVEFQLDVAAVPGALDLVDVLVAIHQPRVVGAEHEARARAAWSDGHRIPRVEDREVRRVEDQILVTTADPLRAPPRRRPRGRVHQPGLEPRRRAQRLARLVPGRHGPGVACRRLQRSSPVEDGQRLAALDTRRIPGDRARRIPHFDPIGGLVDAAFGRGLHLPGEARLCHVNAERCWRYSTVRLWSVSAACAPTTCASKRIMTAPARFTALVPSAGFIRTPSVPQRDRPRTVFDHESRDAVCGVRPLSASSAPAVS